MHAHVARSRCEKSTGFARLLVPAGREQRELVSAQVVHGLALRVPHEERRRPALLRVSLHGLDEVFGNHVLRYSKGEVFMERVPEPELMDEETQARAYS